jgi:DNA-binding transcriptional MerR regulator
MKLNELIEAAGHDKVTPRFVRFLISEGIIDPPSGGRAHASYDEAHLRGILNYVRLRDRGFSLTQVKEIVRSERGETVPIEVAPGLSLHLDLARLDRSLSPADAVARISQILSEILETLKVKGADHVDLSKQ